MPELAGPARGRIRIGLTLCHPSAASPKLHAGPGGPWLPALTAALLCPWRESLARQQAAGAWSASEGRRVPHCGVVPCRGPGRAQLDRGSPRPHVPPPPRRPEGLRLSQQEERPELGRESGVPLSRPQRAQAEGRQGPQSVSKWLAWAAAAGPATGRGDGPSADAINGNVFLEEWNMSRGEGGQK